MTAYSPASSLGWLDFDAAAAERVATLLNGLREPRTLDVLGLGSVAGAISQMLHPGTSYVHTRLRYLMFLPWIFRRLEEDRVAPGDFFRRLRHDEARLIDCLRHMGPGQGVIGYRAGRNLRRMPSSIYWDSLWYWGLRRHPLGLGEYAQRAAALGRYRAARDDDGNVTDAALSVWAPLPDPPQNFLEAEIGFDMRRDEAQVLVDNIRRKNPETLIASLCANPGLAAGCAVPWDVPLGPGAPGVVLPGRVAEQLRHARCFSELTTGPQIAYNVLVARRAHRELDWDTGELAERQLGRLLEWVSLIEGRHEALRSWVDDLPAFWETLRPKRINYGTQRFVSRIVGMAVEFPGGFAEDPAIHEVIQDREIRLKSRRARLGYRAALENWDRGPVGGRHTYRWSVARRYLGEIATALN